MKKKDFFSPSFLMSYQKCPYAAVNNVFTSNDYTKFGELVHTLAEDYYQKPFDLTTVNTEELLKSKEIYNGKFKKKIKNVIENIPNFSTEGYEVFDIESRNTPKEYVHEFFNKRFMAVKLMSNGCGLRGAIDMLLKNDKEFKIIDFKSGSSKPDPFQVHLYGIMCAFAYKIMPEDMKMSCEFWMLESGKVHTYDITSELLEFNYQKFKDIVEEYNESFSLGEFKKTPSFKSCMFCKCACFEGRSYQSNFGESKTVSGY